MIYIAVAVDLFGDGLMIRRGLRGHATSPEPKLV